MNSNESAAREPAAESALSNAPTTPVPWSAAHSLVRQLCGSGGCDVAWAGRKGLISLALPQLEPDLTPEESADRYRYDGMRLAYRPGVPLNTRLMQEAWVESIAAALQDRVLHLKVADLSQWDKESASLLRPLLGRLGPRFGLTLGECGPDADGETQLEHQMIQVALSLYGSPPPDQPPLEVDGRGARPLDLRQAFSAYAFATAFAEAERGLEQGCDNPTELHGLAALALYHKDQMALADPAVGEVFDKHAQAWMAGEDDPLRKSSGLYYLALYYGRFRRNFEAGLEYANRALEQAEAGGCPFHKAWSLNARAYQKARSGRIEEAYQDCVQALEISQKEPEAKLWWHLTGNLAQLGAISGDLDSARDWSRKQAAYESQVPMALFPVSFNHAPQDRRDMAWTAGRFRERLQMAQARMDLPGLALSHYFLGDLTYRTGHAGEAFGHFHCTRRLWSVLGEDAESLSLAYTNEVRAAVRAGELEMAESLLVALLQAGGSDPFQSLEYQALLAQVSARRGEHETALSEADGIVKTAGSNPFLLLSVAPKVAEVYRLCGQPEKIRVLESVRTLARDPQVHAEDAFMALACLPELNAEDAELLLELAPAALEEAECWWSLGSLVPSLRPHAGERSEQYEFLLAAARQRTQFAACA